MYTDALPLAQHRIKKNYHFEGVYFPETMYFWGANRSEDYGWHSRENKNRMKVRGQYTQYE